MTREEYDKLRDAVYLGQADAFVVFDAVIDLYFDNLELQGKIYELTETLDGRG